jgi:hypothetical protein
VHILYSKLELSGKVVVNHCLALRQLLLSTVKVVVHKQALHGRGGWVVDGRGGWVGAHRPKYIFIVMGLEKAFLCPSVSPGSVGNSGSDTRSTHTPFGPLTVSTFYE